MTEERIGKLWSYFQKMGEPIITQVALSAVQLLPRRHFTAHELRAADGDTGRGQSSWGPDKKLPPHSGPLHFLFHSITLFHFQTRETGVSYIKGEGQLSHHLRNQEVLGWPWSLLAGSRKTIFTYCKHCFSSVLVSWAEVWTRDPEEWFKIFSTDNWDCLRGKQFLLE